MCTKVEIIFVLLLVMLYKYEKTAVEPDISTFPESLSIAFTELICEVAELIK